MAHGPNDAQGTDGPITPDRLDMALRESEAYRGLAPDKQNEISAAMSKVFGYLADAYGLQQRAVEIGGRKPSARQLANLIERAKNEGVKIIFVQPQFSKKTAKSLARSIGGAVVAMDPLDDDYVGNLERMAKAIQKSFNDR